MGKEARKIAERFNANADSAEIAGYLHDISAVYSNDVRIQVSYDLGIEVLSEEEAFPMIIHQKISKEMARDIFNIMDQEILDAVGCHTTLKKNSTILDKVLFVADKIETSYNTAFTLRPARLPLGPREVLSKRQPQRTTLHRLTNIAAAYFVRLSR